MSDESGPDTGFSMQKGFEHFRQGRFGAAIVHFNHFKNVQPVTKEITRTSAIALHMSGRIARDYYKELELSLRDLDEARKLAVGLGDQQLTAEIVDDLEKTTTLLAKRKKTATPPDTKPRRRKI